MRKITLIAVSLLVICLLVSGCSKKQNAEVPAVTAAPTEAPTPAPTAAPTPEPTATPIPVHSLSGTVASVAANAFSLRLANGNAIQFPLSGSAGTALKEGDEVTVEYTGDVLANPQITGLTVTKEASAAPAADALPANVVVGTVTGVTGNAVTVQVSASETYTIYLSQATEYSFALEPLTPPVAAGDQVRITFDGNVQNSAVATLIEVVEPAANRAKASSSSSSSSSSSDSQKDKKLTGTVTSLTSSKVTIETDNHRSWTFHIGNSTKQTGSYSLEVGARIRVTYDGYASGSPTAKTIRVIAPPSDSPSPSQTKTVTGKIVSIDKTTMKLDNGYGFYIGEATYYDGPVHPTDVVKVTYYRDGVNVATKIKYLYTD